MVCARKRGPAAVSRVASLTKCAIALLRLPPGHVLQALAPAQAPVLRFEVFNTAPADPSVPLLSRSRATRTRACSSSSPTL